MAKYLHIATVAGLLCSAGLFGCQPAGTAMLDSPPPPSFQAPVVKTTLSPSQPVQPSVQPPPETSVSSSQQRLIELAHIPRSWVPPVKARPWKWIVIHHSATSVGGAVRFDKMHRGRGWDELGYHFVIGNGTDTPDGLVEVGSRWPKQKWGAHDKTPSEQYNNYGIGICLVGNFDLEYPTRKQLDSLATLCAYMMITYHITPDRVLGHRDTKATECPGRHLDLNAVRRMAEAKIRQWGYDPQTLQRR